MELDNNKNKIDNIQQRKDNQVTLEENKKYDDEINRSKK